MPGKRPEPSLEFVQLLTSHQSRLYAYVLSLLGNRTQAEDVMQEEKQRLLSECIGKLNERYQELIRRRSTQNTFAKSLHETLPSIFDLLSDDSRRHIRARRTP